MGFYSRFLLPHLCDRLMGQPFLAVERKKILADVVGDILEIGFGTGLNLAHYPDRVREITVVDPNAGMNKVAQRRIADSGIKVHAHQLGGEALPFGAESFDCVVSTWTLGSIPEVERALGEVYRDLRPGGRLVFLEHGLSDDPSVSKWQRRLNPIEELLADGCRLDLDIEAIVKGKSFGQVKVERFQIDRLPRTHGTMYRGSAVK
jgi:SAM-dependent methyltransferase